VKTISGEIASWTSWQGSFALDDHSFCHYSRRCRIFTDHFHFFFLGALFGFFCSTGDFDKQFAPGGFKMPFMAKAGMRNTPGIDSGTDATQLGLGYPGGREFPG